MPSQMAKETYIKLLGAARPEWVASMQRNEDNAKSSGIGPVFSTLAHSPDEDGSCQDVRRLLEMPSVFQIGLRSSEWVLYTVVLYA